MSDAADTRPVEAWTDHDGLDAAGRERVEHGGIKIGSAFFGFLTATSMIVLLSAAAAAIGAALSRTTGTSVDEASSQVSSSTGTAGIWAGVVLLVIVFLSYLCGGYVAGRMARFDGVKQGLAVWLWALVIAIVAVGITVAMGTDLDPAAQLDSIAQISLSDGDLTTGGIAAAAIVVIGSLLGALAGGALGMRFHRRVDKTGRGI